VETEQLVQLDRPEPQGHPDLLELQVLQEHLDQVDPQELLELLAQAELQDHQDHQELQGQAERQGQQDLRAHQEHLVSTETDTKQHLQTTLLWELLVELPEELVYLIQ